MNIITPGYASKFNKLAIPTNKEIQDFMEEPEDDEGSYLRDLGIYIEPPKDIVGHASALPTLKMDLLEIMHK